jgi:hypothetical protein
MRGALVLGLGILLLAGCNSKPSGPTIDASQVDLSTVRQQAQAMSKAALEQDHETLVDYTHPKIVQGMGGRAKMIERLRGMAKEMEASGFTMVANEVGEPGEPVVEGSTAYVVLPTKLQLKGPKVRGVSEGFLIGVSEDAGKTWKFIDGAGLKTPEDRKRAFPELPVRLRLPERKPPVFTDVTD